MPYQLPANMRNSPFRQDNYLASMNWGYPDVPRMLDKNGSPVCDMKEGACLGLVLLYLTINRPFKQFIEFARSAPGRIQISRIMDIQEIRYRAGLDDTNDVNHFMQSCGYFPAGSMTLAYLQNASTAMYLTHKIKPGFAYLFSLYSGGTTDAHVCAIKVTPNSVGGAMCYHLYDPASGEYAFYSQADLRDFINWLLENMQPVVHEFSLEAFRYFAPA